MVEQRLAEAASVLGRLPPMRVYGYSSLWPRLLVDYSSVVCHRPGTLRLPPPEPAAISRMEETLGWSGWLQPIDSRIVWQRANGRRWKEICSAVGLARAAAHEHWRYALCLIAWRLNGRPAPTRTSRRMLIARFRSEHCPKRLVLALPSCGRKRPEMPGRPPSDGDGGEARRIALPKNIAETLKYLDDLDLEALRVSVENELQRRRVADGR